MKKYIYIIFLLTLSCCKKDQLEEKTTINSQDFFLEMTDIDKLKKTEKTKLNDSTYRIRGLVNSLQVTGYLTQNDEKIDWWEVADTNGEKVAMVEYRIVDKKVFANQYKVFNNSKLDVYKSKYYTILGVSRGASQDEIRKAYHKLAKEHHPDRFVNSSDSEKKYHENKMKEINDAYENLTK